MTSPQFDVEAALARIQSRKQTPSRGSRALRGQTPTAGGEADVRTVRSFTAEQKGASNAARGNGCAMLSSLSEIERDQFEERAAIQEYEGQLSRAAAEADALRGIVAARRRKAFDAKL